jgi:hypothetical protein
LKNISERPWKFSERLILKTGSANDRVALVSGAPAYPQDDHTHGKHIVKRMVDAGFKVVICCLAGMLGWSSQGWQLSTSGAR